MLRRHNIEVVGNFMLGFPKETKAQMRETLALALRLDLTAANFSIYVPMPGTPLFDELLHGGHLHSLDQVDGSDYVSFRNDLSALTPQQLARFRSRCMLRFYLRPRTLLNVYRLATGGMSMPSLLRRVYGMYLRELLWRSR